MNVFEVLREKLKESANVDIGHHFSVEHNVFIKTKDAIEIVNQVEQEYNNGWIPCSERLPNKEEFLKNDGRFLVTDGNRVYQSIYDIYINQCFKTVRLDCIIDLGYRSTFEVDKCVVAWQPLPITYREEG